MGRKNELPRPDNLALVHGVDTPLHKNKLKEFLRTLAEITLNARLV
jgi:hypothetical protein